MNRMDYLHRKSRGRALNESVLNEAVYRMDDVREMWYKKVRMLKDPRKQINLHSKLSKIEPEARNEMLARILLYNFPGTSGGFINQIITSTFGDSEWLDILNSRFGTDVTMQYLKDNFDKLHGPELSQKTLQIIGKKEDSYIKMIESGRGNVKSEDVVKVAQSTKRTYIAGSFEEVYNLVTTRNDFQGRYEKNPDGTISINMAEIPLTMIRAMYGLRVIDDSQPLVYIVFGPVGGNDKAIKDHAKQELDLFLRNSHDEKELQEMHIGYYDLRPCGLEYWWTNVSKRFVSKRDDEAADNVRNSNATITISSDGDCVLMVNSEESELEMDPAVNPGNSPVTVPIEDEYGFDTVKESKNNDIRMNRFRKNWTESYHPAKMNYQYKGIKKINEALYKGNVSADIESFCNKIATGEPNSKIAIFADYSGSTICGPLTGSSEAGYIQFLQSISDTIASTNAAEYIDVIGFTDIIDRYSITDVPAGYDISKAIRNFSNGGTGLECVYEYINDNYVGNPSIAGIIIVTDSDMFYSENRFYEWSKRNPAEANMIVQDFKGKCLYIDCDPYVKATAGLYSVAVIPGSDVLSESMISRYNSNPLLEGKALTSEEKMDRWHNGTRKENIKACNIDKLKEYRKICRAKGYTEEAKQINAEINRRKKEGINEGYNEGIREHFSILVGSGRDTADVIDVICTENDLQTVALAHYYWKEKQERRPIACVAKRGYGVDFSDYDIMFADCM